jgi:NADH-quinone oxidoreductase subunit N
VSTTLFFFSLAGVPPLGGWFAKFVIFRSLLGSNESIGVILGIVGAVNAVISLVYYARISKIIWMDEPKTEYSEKQILIENPLKVVGLITVLITIFSGIFPGIFSNLGDIASMFLNN